MDQKQLDVIKERVVALEDYRWEAEISEEINLSEVVAIQNNGFGRYGVAIEMDERDAEFIAHARQDVPALLAEVERLQKRLAQTEECYEIMEKAAFKASDKINGFKKALEFYANENNHLRVDMYAESIVMQDKCEIARQALGGEFND